MSERFKITLLQERGFPRMGCEFERITFARKGVHLVNHLLLKKKNRKVESKLY